MDIKNVAQTICFRFCIRGVCDSAYIANSLALDAGIGNGAGIFYKTELPNDTDYLSLAESLQSIYGFNIAKNETYELAEIIRTGEINRISSKIGMKRFIERCKNDKKSCDEWRKDYLDGCINQMSKNLLSVMYI